ncbi:TB2/DP1, HVA22 family-domain-containing protein, partial [Phlyctochytrium arcticum]
QVDKALGSVPLFASFEKSSGIRKIHLLGLSTSMLLVVLLVFKNVYAGIITDTIGYLYPALLSLKAVGGDKDVQAQWLGYWVIFGFFHLCEYAIEGVLRVFPFYFPFKLFTIIWLISPSTKGAASVYTKVLKPFIPVCENLGKALVNRGKPSKPAD